MYTLALPSISICVSVCVFVCIYFLEKEFAFAPKYKSIFKQI